MFVAAGMNLYFLPLASGTDLSTCHEFCHYNLSHIKREDKPLYGALKEF